MPMTGVSMMLVCGDEPSMSVDIQHGANVVLMELEKSLRSQQPGEQVEAIISLPQLFNTYPLPMLINAVFLRLAEVFRVGTNFQRFQIIKVSEQSRRHLEKLSSSDEVVRRILSVTYSTDVMARALTVRMLGSLASVCADKRNIHHALMQALDSHEAIELRAATRATANLSLYSTAFAESICDKMRAMMNRLDTSDDLKLALIPIFRCMRHRSGEIAGVARSQCLALLNVRREKTFKVALLKTLTILSTSMPDTVREQIDILFQNLDSAYENRKDVHTVCLRGLRVIAACSPHMWVKRDTERLCGYANKLTQEVGGPSLLLEVVKVMRVLVNSIAFLQTIDKQQHQCPVVTICLSSIHKQHLPTVAVAMSVMASVCRQQCDTERSQHLLTALVMTAHDVVLNTCLTTNASPAVDQPSLTTCLSALSTLSTLSDNMGKVSSDFVISFLPYVDAGEEQSPIITALCDYLVRVSDNSDTRVLAPHWRNIMNILKASTDSGVVIRLCRVLFNNVQPESLKQLHYEIIHHTQTHCTPWSMYCVARQACRYSQYDAAHRMFDTLRQGDAVITEKNSFWLEALSHLSQAESGLSRGAGDARPSAARAITALNSALQSYALAMSALKAGVTSKFSHRFQVEYVTLRVKVAEMFVNIISSINEDDDIAASQLTLASLRQDIIAVAEQCRLCSHGFFNIDGTSLHIICITDRLASFMQNIIDYLLAAEPASADFIREGIITSESDSPMQNASGKCETRMLTRQYKKYQEQLSNTVRQRAENQRVVIIGDLLNVALNLYCVSMPMPRFYLQALQHTNVKLFISPQAKSVTEPITVDVDTGLQLHVEGIVERPVQQRWQKHDLNQPRRGRRQSVEFRHIKTVTITVRSTIQNRAPTPVSFSSIKGGHGGGGREVEANVDVANDYFSHQFILPFPIPGLHEVTVSVRVTDAAGLTWDMTHAGGTQGPGSSAAAPGSQYRLPVKAYFHHVAPHTQGGPTATGVSGATANMPST